MQPADLFGAIEVGERAGNPQHAVIAARRQAHGLGRVAQQLLALRVRVCDLFQQRGGRLGVGADLRKAGLGLAGELDVARRRHACGDLR